MIGKTPKSGKITSITISVHNKKPGFHYNKSWLIDKRLYGKRGPAYIKRVDHAKWLLAKDSVTWEDIGGEFHGHAQVSMQSRTLDTYFKHYDFGRMVKFHMYGSATNGFEGACITKEKDTEGYPKLSPLGEINVKAVKWCRKHNKDKGVQYTPVALLIDFSSGWQHPYPDPGQHYKVWGNMPYQKGDYQIDNVFRWLYPQYEDGGWFKDERGFLTSTPFGDKFDVLTSNVHQRILDQYQVVCLLGELEMTSELITKLKKFVTDGGDLIVSAAQAKVLGEDFCGVSVSSKMHHGYGGFSLSDKKVFEEKDYIYPEVIVNRAKVVAVSEDKLPLITIASSGKGRVIVITPDCWMTTRLKVSDEGSVHPQRYELLKTVQHILGQYLKDLDFVEIDGSEIQYITNLTDNTKRLLVTLVNNSLTDDWQGSVSLKDGSIVSAREWMQEKELIGKRPLKVSIPKGELRVIEIIGDREIFENV